MSTAISAADRSGSINRTLEWEDCEGAVNAYDENGDHVIEINALQDRDKCLKWNEKYTPGREWFVMEMNNVVAKGHAPNLRVAKKEALAALVAHRCNS
ncbi:hypothetical protein [Glutamicibacter sp. TV12E]|uniref:hypothetical protein n=1 Tax=Glutamicibacter sp. TV12E TaxID=3446362 RepID=UPI004033198F